MAAENQISWQQPDVAVHHNTELNCQTSQSNTHSYGAIIPHVNDVTFKPQVAQAATTNIKCVFVGDPEVGKTCLVVSYTSNGFPDEHKPTAFDNYSVDVCVDDRLVKLQICDTGGQNEVASLRHLSYQDAQVFVLCFSVVHPNSFRSLRTHWVPELNKYGPSKSAFILVGCRCDQRHDVARILALSNFGDHPVNEETAQELARDIGALAYVECSSLTQKNLKTVFDLAIWEGLKVYDLQAAEEAELKQKMANGKSSSKQKHKQLINQNGGLDKEELAAIKKSKSTWKKLLCVS